MTPDDNGLLQSRQIGWLSDDDLAAFHDSACALLDAWRPTIGWADESLDALAAQLRDLA